MTPASQIRADLLRDIDAYLARTGMGQTGLGRRAVEDLNFVGELRRGRCPSPAVAARVRHFMATGVMLPSSRTGSREPLAADAPPIGGRAQRQAKGSAAWASQALLRALLRYGLVNGLPNMTMAQIKAQARAMGIRG